MLSTHVVIKFDFSYTYIKYCIIDNNEQMPVINEK